MQSSPPDFAATAHPQAETFSAAAHLPPARLGHFVILERLGTGGMGMVFSAYDNRLDRKVAIKIPAARGTTQPWQAQLLAEARTLARLSHPNVVQIHEANTLPNGNVYLAMEYVVGASLREHQQTRHPWRRILQWYVQAGEGLAAAHRADLIHGDFKPDNVLLGRDGRVRVADFGLSSLRHKVEGERAGHDGPGPVRGGTPGYMAPELFSADVCDQRIDQFSFCVSLYEALYEERPYPDRAFVGSSPPQRRRAPSGTVPRWLRHTLDRGLSLDPQQRFPSMSALLAELTRQRVRRSLVITAAGFLLASGALALNLYVGTNPCPIQTDAFAGIWMPGEQHRLHRALGSSGLSYAETIWHTAKQAFDEYSSQWQNAQQDACRATYVERTQSPQLLDLRMACLTDRRSELQAAVQSMIENPKLGAEHTEEVLSELGDLESCSNIRALRLGMPLPKGKQSLAKVAAAREHLANGRAALAMGDLPRAGVAIAHAKKAMDNLHYAPVDAELAFVESRIEIESGEMADAAESLRLVIDQATATRHDDLVLDAWLALLRHTGFYHPKVADLRIWMNSARAAFQRLGHPDDSRSITLDRIQGQVLSAQGRFREAATVLETASQSALRRWGDQSIHIAGIYHEMGNALAMCGEPEAAHHAYTDGLHIKMALFGADHPYVGKTRLTLGLHLGERLGRIGEGLVELNLAKRILARSYNLDHPLLGTVHQGLALLNQLNGEYQRALPDASRAVAIFEKHLGTANPRVGEALMAVGVLRHLTGDYDAALSAYRRALAIQISALGETHLDVGLVRSNLGEVYLALGQLEHSMSEFQRAHDIMEKALGPLHVEMAFPLKGIGLTLLAQNKHRKAVPYLERALDVAADTEGNAAERAQIQWALARSLATPGSRSKRCRELAREALSTYQKLGSSWQERRREIEQWLKPSHERSL